MTSCYRGFLNFVGGGGVFICKTPHDLSGKKYAGNLTPENPPTFRNESEPLVVCVCEFLVCVVLCVCGVCACKCLVCVYDVRVVCVSANIWCV